MSETGIPDPPQFSQPPVSEKKITRGHSCMLCQQRKVKCDGQKPCSTCVKSGKECIAQQPSLPRRRKPRVSAPKPEAVFRLQHVKQTLQDSNAKPEGATPENSEEKRIDIESTPSGSRSPESQLPQGTLIVERGQSRYVENHFWTGLTDEIRDSRELRPLSPDADTPMAPTIQPQHSTADALLFGRPILDSLVACHPQPVHIFRLWQTCLDNVCPLVKIFHAPTVQQMVLEAGSNLEKISKSTEALMFAIYLSAVISLTENECQSMIGESRGPLIAKFSNATQQALINAEFLKTSDMVILQSFTLYLLSMRQQYDAQTHWLLAGLATRCALRLGLHRESVCRQFSIFDAEIRRRLWWQIVILDSISARLAGAGLVDLHSSWDTKKPLNVNDSDLWVSMKEPPSEHTGITEMLFCSIRYEMCGFMKYFLRTAMTPGSGPSLAEIDKDIDELENDLELKFLRHCDSSIPFHFMASCLGKVAIAQMRLISHHPQRYPDKGASLPQSEKDFLFSTALMILEYYNMGPTKWIKGFMWHVSRIFPFEAFIYVLMEINKRPDGELVSNAKQQITEAYKNHPEFISDTSNSSYFAMGNLAIRVWLKGNSGTQNLQAPCQAGQIPSFVLKLCSQRQIFKDITASLNVPSTSDIPPTEYMDGAIQTNQQYQAGNNQWPDATSDLDFMPMPMLPYNPFDHTDPMDWEYWQALLEDREIPAFSGNGQHLLF